MTRFQAPKLGVILRIALLDGGQQAAVVFPRDRSNLDPAVWPLAADSMAVNDVLKRGLLAGEIGLLCCRGRDSRRTFGASGRRLVSLSIVGRCSSLLPALPEVIEDPNYNRSSSSQTHSWSVYGNGKL